MTEPNRNAPLADLDPTKRFSDRASDYVRFRPDYPPAAIDFVLRDFLDPRRVRAADIGAGTGISARLLADRGVRVVAVEPNREMRSAAAPHPLVEWHEGSAEASGLAQASVDLVVSAQAFHWFRQREAVREFRRLVRPQGRLALLWNKRDRDDPFSLSYIEAIHAVNGEHPAERRTVDPGVLEGGGRFAAPEVRGFPHAQLLDREGLVGRAASASYVPKEGPGFEELTRLLDRLFERYRDERGLVALRYRTEVWLTAPMAPAPPEERLPA